MNSGFCECGHSKFEHVAGSKECTIPECKCGVYHDVDMQKAIDRVCTFCGRGYKCSYPSKNAESVCNVCRKGIETRYPGDLTSYLFGFRDSLVSRLKAMQLAMEIHEAGLNVETLWKYYKAGVNHTNIPTS